MPRAVGKSSIGPCPEWDTDVSVFKYRIEILQSME
jgi:hypothetical protein